jgi:hypothetical protein
VICRFEGAGILFEWPVLLQAILVDQQQNVEVLHNLDLGTIEEIAGKLN